MKSLAVTIALIPFVLSAYAQIDHWETAVYADSVWKYIVPSFEPPSTWRNPGFDDSSWNSGIGFPGGWGMFMGGLRM